MNIKHKLVWLYENHYKKLLVIPFLILLFSISVILFHYFKTGEIVERDVSLKGGSTITLQVEENIDLEKLKKDLVSTFKEDFLVRKLTSSGKSVGIVIETSMEDSSAVVEFLKNSIKLKSITVETIGKSIGSSFFKQVFVSIVIAFILMAVVVLIYFRILIPSAYILLAAISDILFAWAMIILLDVKLSTAGVAAFLMLIGYSVDTDILLTTRVLKREGKIDEKIVQTMGTGFIMTFASIVATSIAYLATPSEVLKQIMLILFLGLIADLWNTWIQNAILLKVYLKKLGKEND